MLGDRRRVPLTGDRRTGPAAAKGGPPHGAHEHQAGPRAQDLRPDLPAEGLLAVLLTMGSHQKILSYLRWPLLLIPN